ncbi:MAG TPA: DegT/DnrJ/EryC1/StrS family aminotransferase [Caldimonas sp.]|nr:DegT/DnrJ/EryC1/StrS family aminotransferase [Caldimonas sp.]
MTVPFLDLAREYADLRREIDEAVARILTSARFIGGPEVARFEEAFADYCQASHCVGVGNGLDALYLILRAWGIGPGDEVLVPANTFIATWLAVSRVGATPVPVEPDPATHNLDPARLEAAMTPRSRALLVTHLYGQPADLDPILEMARACNLKVAEDAAQAHGACYKFRRVGAHSHAAAWSFYPAKNLGAMGDGGAVTTDDAELAYTIRSLANYGSAQKHVHSLQGVNSRLDPIQAAILAVKLGHLDAWNARRSEIAAQYAVRLAGSGLVLPAVPDWAAPAWHLYVVQSDHRDRLQRRLAEAGIGSQIHYPVPPHLQAAYRDLGLPPGSLPIAERLAERVLSLPVGPYLTSQETDRVVEACLRWG